MPSIAGCPAKRANASTDSNDGQPNQSVAPPASQAPETPAAPSNPSGLTPEQLKRLQEGDKPIEYDPVGQAIVDQGNPGAWGEALLRTRWACSR